MLVDGLHGHSIAIGSFFTGTLIAFMTGVLITLLLLILTLRAARLPGTPFANILFALCALCWSAGGLGRLAALGSDVPHWSTIVRISWALQYIGAAAIPIPILACWRRYAVDGWRESASRILGIVAMISAAAISATLIFRSTGLLDIGVASMEHAATFSSTVLLVLGGAFLPRRSTPSSVYYPSLAMAAAAFGTSVVLLVRGHAAPDAGQAAFLGALGSHLVLLIALFAFFLFARFRYADIFVRYGTRILLVGLLTSILTSALREIRIEQLTSTHAPPAAFTLHLSGVVLLANMLLLSFTFVDDFLSRQLNRWLFRPADTRSSARKLAADLSAIHNEMEIAPVVEDAARVPLELSGARLVPFDKEVTIWPAGLIEGEIVELNPSDSLHRTLPMPNAEVLVPVTSDGRVSHLLLAAPGPARPGLVQHDLNFLRMVALQAGSRFDMLRREREAIDRESREALLRQQIAEAELQALRAQIHPHFLFNSLNTIADLVVRDPLRAETMTLRLAATFRHVLRNASRSLTTVREEIEFLRTYLAIEEVRFSDRLTVEFDVDPEVEGDAIPSLILQPLVENAMKHGLGPKPGPGRLIISAKADGPILILRVEDDGMGLSTSSPAAHSNGMGVANVAGRLRTLYHDQAGVALDPREGGGTRVTVTLPRNKVEKA